MKKKIIYESVKGLNRVENQDNFLIIKDDCFSIMFVFDGVGSALNGKKATELCHEFISRMYRLFYQSEMINLSELMFETNQYLLSQNYSELFTTYCSIFISEKTPESIIYSSMGDSRIYIISPQYIEQLTIDDKPSFGPKNVITKCLGMSSLSKDDFKQSIFSISDKNLLLCTDGFYSLLEKEPLLFFEIMNTGAESTIKKRISSIIKDKNTDDSTFILIK